MPTMQTGSLATKSMSVSLRTRRRRTTAPDASRPTTLHTFFPRSMPRTAIFISVPPFEISDETTSPGGRGGPFHKLRYTRGGNPRDTRARHTHRGVVPGRDAGGSEEQAHLPLGHKRLASPRDPRSTHAIDLCVRCGLPRTRNRRRPRAASLQHRNDAASSQRDRDQSHTWRSRHSDPRSSRMARRQRPQSARQHLAPAAAASLTRAQSPRKHLAVHAGELAVEPCLQILRRHRRPLLLRLEHAHRPALENHVHRPPRLGTRRSLIVRVGIRDCAKFALRFSARLRPFTVGGPEWPIVVVCTLMGTF